MSFAILPTNLLRCIGWRRARTAPARVWLLFRSYRTIGFIAMETLSIFSSANPCFFTLPVNPLIEYPFYTFPRQFQRPHIGFKTNSIAFLTFNSHSWSCSWKYVTGARNDRWSRKPQRYLWACLALFRRWMRLCLVKHILWARDTLEPLWFLQHWARRKRCAKRLLRFL